MKKIIIGAALVLSLSACGTADPETLDVSGTVTEMEFEPADSACTMAFALPRKGGGGGGGKSSGGSRSGPVKPATGGGNKPAPGGVQPPKKYKSGSYKVRPFSGVDSCHKDDCWEIEIRTVDGQMFDTCVTEDIYKTYRVGDTFPKKG